MDLWLLYPSALYGAGICHAFCKSFYRFAAGTFVYSAACKCVHRFSDGHCGTENREKTLPEGQCAVAVLLFGHIFAAKPVFAYVCESGLYVPVVHSLDDLWYIMWI